MRKKPKADKPKKKTPVRVDIFPGLFHLQVIVTRKDGTARKIDIPPGAGINLNSMILNMKESETNFFSKRPWATDRKTFS